jgi:hypothetical protein
LEDKERYGEMCYNNFRKTIKAQRSSHELLFLPTWGELNENNRQAWIEAADVVRDNVMEEAKH